MDSDRIRVLEWLRGHSSSSRFRGRRGEASIAAVAAALGLPGKDVAMHLRDLRDSGLVEFAAGPGRGWSAVV